MYLRYCFYMMTGFSCLSPKNFLFRVNSWMEVFLIWYSVQHLLTYFFVHWKMLLFACTCRSHEIFISSKYGTWICIGKFVHRMLFWSWLPGYSIKRGTCFTTLEKNFFTQENVWCLWCLITNWENKQCILYKRFLRNLLRVIVFAMLIYLVHGNKNLKCRSH